MSPYSTGIIEDELERCEDIEDFKSLVIPKLMDQRQRWSEKMTAIMAESGLSVRDFARACRVSEPAVRKWLKGSLPQSRDAYIRIAFAAGYDLGETNRFLRRYGCCPELYPRSLEDSACIFVLGSPKLKRSYDTYTELLDLMRQELQAEGAAESVEYSTMELSGYLAAMEEREEMLRFVRENAATYATPYAKLYNFILAFLEINLADAFGDSATSFHAMASESGWSSSLRHCITEIRRGRWFPLRHKLISLGLHLNMDAEDIDRMLTLAKMDTLYPQNPVEAAVKFAINEAKLSSEGDEIIADGSNSLCLFVKDILSQLELSESEYLIDDL